MYVLHCVPVTVDCDSPDANTVESPICFAESLQDAEEMVNLIEYEMLKRLPQIEMLATVLSDDNISTANHAFAQTALVGLYDDIETKLKIGNLWEMNKYKIVHTKIKPKKASDYE